MTIAALAHIRQTIAHEQSSLAQYQKTTDRIRTNRIRPLFEDGALSVGDFLNPEKISAVTEQLATLKEKMLKINPRTLVQTTEIETISPEREALSVFITHLTTMRDEIVLQREKYEGDKEEFDKALKALESTLNAAQLLQKKIATQWNLNQSQNFSTKVSDLFSAVRKFLNLIATKVTKATTTITDIRERGRADASAWDAIEKVISDSDNQSQMREAYTQMQSRLDEFGNFIDTATHLTTQLKNQPVTADQKQTLIMLRKALEGYLTTLNITGTMIGVRINNPTALGSRVVNFAESWYKPTEQISEDNLTLAQNASEALGIGQDIIKRLDDQAGDAARLLQIIDTNILKQSNLAARSLYTFSFIGTILAQVTGVLTWLETPAVTVLDKVGTVFNIDVEALLVPVPVVLLGSAVIFEGFAFALQKGALKLAGG